MISLDEYDITAAFKAIEDELIASMLRNMDHHRAEETKEGIEWSMWQAEQLKALEKYKRDNQKKYKKRFRSLNREIEELIRQARETGNMEQELEILDAIKAGFNGAKKIDPGVTGEFFRLNDRKLEALIEATTHDMERAEVAVLRKADDDYRKAIYNAQVYANTGAGTYEKAVDMAVKDMLSRGLACIEYANGARHTLSDYADMAIRTASKRAYLQGEGEKRQEWGIATVIVNKRGNPCPKCLPFCGKVLIDDVWSGGSRKDGKYPLVSTAIAHGLYHPRCKDSHTTYFPGISTADDTWTQEELEAIGETNRQEAQQQHAERQEKKYERLGRYSLDRKSREKYNQKKKEWETVVKADDSGILDDENTVFEGKAYQNAIKNEEDKIYMNNVETAILLDRRGNVIFRESNGAKNYVQFSSSQLAEMKDKVLTHNHPSNSTFSSEDVSLMASHDLKAIRATGKIRTYQLSRGHGARGKDLAVDYKAAMVDNKKITDKKYAKLSNDYRKGIINREEYAEKVQNLNNELNLLNSEWLKNNAKTYGYRYSVIERR